MNPDADLGALGRVDVARIGHVALRQPRELRIAIRQLDAFDARTPPDVDVVFVGDETRCADTVVERGRHRWQAERIAILGRLHRHFPCFADGDPDDGDGARDTFWPAMQPRLDLERRAFDDAGVAGSDLNRETGREEPDAGFAPRPHGDGPGKDNGGHERRGRGRKCAAPLAQAARIDDAGEIELIEAAGGVVNEQLTERRALAAFRQGRRRREAIFEFRAALFDVACDLPVARASPERPDDRQRPHDPQCCRGRGEHEQAAARQRQESGDEGGGGDETRGPGCNLGHRPRPLEREPAPANAAEPRAKSRVGVHRLSFLTPRAA